MCSLTLYDPVEYSPQGSSVHGIFQVRILQQEMGDLPDPGVEPVSPVSPSLTGRLFSTEIPGKP